MMELGTFHQSARSEGVSTNLLLKQVKNRKLATVKVFINRRECTALVDSGCSQTLVSKAVCHWWRQKEMGAINHPREDFEVPWVQQDQVGSQVGLSWTDSCWDLISSSAVTP